MSNNTTTAERLERVREERGYQDLRSFWRDLVKPFEGDEGYDISYDAARTYHVEGRQPPAAYLARVAKVFGVRLEWLVTGEGQPTESEEVLFRAVTPQGAVPAGPRHLALGRHATNALLEAWAELAKPHSGRLGQVPGETGLTLAGHIWQDTQKAVRAPLDATGLPVPDRIDDAFNDFAVSVAEAIRRYARTVRKTAPHEQEENDA